MGLVPHQAKAFLMASKAFQLFSVILILLIIPLLSHTIRADSNVIKKSSGFGFIHELQGSKKGDTVAGISNLKIYLQRFGYLSYSNTKGQSPSIYSNVDDVFDEHLESAIKSYQRNFNLNATGYLDKKTVAKMTMPRCGVSDHHHHHEPRVGGTENPGDGSSPFIFSSQYTFFRGKPKWPSSKYTLTYGFLPGTPNAAVAPVDEAFAAWQANSHFKFKRTPKYKDADVVLGFARGDHQDGHPFDGRGGVLAHAFAPTDGRLHLDADEQWAVGSYPDAFDVKTVVMHEIGHVLGLGHSPIEEAIMYPSIAPEETKDLYWDDIQGVKALYNV